MVSGVWVFKSVNTFKIPVHVVSLLLLSVLWAFANIFPDATTQLPQFKVQCWIPSVQVITTATSRIPQCKHQYFCFMLFQW